VPLGAGGAGGVSSTGGAAGTGGVLSTGGAAGMGGVSSTGGAAGTGGASGGAAGQGASAGTSQGGSSTGGGGNGGSGATGVLDAFAPGACQTCLVAKVGMGMIPADPAKGIPNAIDCSKVVQGCGSLDENCKQSMDCVATAQPKNPSNLDCAVESCALVISMEPKAIDFFSCLALNCATACGATPGFGNTLMCK
jgi:hypothetical protein